MVALAICENAQGLGDLWIDGVGRTCLHGVVVSLLIEFGLLGAKYRRANLGWSEIREATERFLVVFPRPHNVTAPFAGSTGGHEGGDGIAITLQGLLDFV